MENKYARRISSLLSINSASSEQSSSIASSHARKSSTKISGIPSPSMHLGPPRVDIPPPVPDPTQPHEQGELLGVHISQPEPGSVPISSNGVDPPPDDNSNQSPSMPKPLSAESRPKSRNFSDSRLDSKLEGASESRSESSSKSRSRSRASRASRTESKGGIRSPSPPKFLNALNPSELRKSTRKSWLPGKSRTTSPSGGSDSAPQAWLFGGEVKIPYDMSNLVSFQEVAELWDKRGNTLIYLHPGASGKGPSFKISSASFASSRKLSSVVQGRSRSSASNRPYYQRASSDKNQSQVDLSHNESGVPSPPIGPLTSVRTQILLSPTSSPPRSPQLDTPAEGIPQGRRAVSDSYDLQSRRATSDSYDMVTEEIHLHLPLPLHTDITNPESVLTPDDVETLIAIRNVFAFLVGQPLVATLQSPSLFDIFLRIADFLRHYQFSNFDGSTLGEESESNFKRYVEDFKLTDVRSSREKTIEAIVLGERMKSVQLYNEGFVHGVGKYEDIVQLHSPKFHLITEGTLQRMERATIDLGIRLKRVRGRLNDFEFPSLFSGIAQSTTSTESKIVRFKEWQSAFMSMRKHVMSFYANRYGAWPPSARSKKNSFEESGLNRILLCELYQDFCDLYETLVDRDSFTTRTGELNITESTDNSDFQASADVLRKILDEFDQSSPPVQPAVPFDTPQLPSLATVRRDFNLLDPKRQKKERSKKLQDDEINQALMQSYNRDCIKPTPFLEAFMSYERKAARGKSIDEIEDLRNGQWIFMYVVLQSLPLVVVDAPNLMWTENVEYFLCEVPKGAPPWHQEDHSRKMGWYGIAGGTGVVSLPAELVEHGVEGIYARSYLWKVAQQWTNYDPANDVINHEELFDGLRVPSSPGSPQFLDSRSASPGRLHRDSINMGLEALPLPAGVAPSGARRSSSYDPSRSFENILGLVSKESEQKKA